MKPSTTITLILALLLLSCACESTIKKDSTQTVKKQENPILSASQGKVAVEGGQIWYGIMGKGSKTPLLCLHGGPGGTSKGFYNLSEIAEERPVILFDQLGSGRSDHHEDTSLLKVEHLVEQVKAIQAALNLNAFYLVGTSWGSGLALEYYSKYPEGIKGIVFLSPYFSTPIWTADADTLIAALPDSIQMAIRKGEEDSLFTSESYLSANRYFASLHGRRKAYIIHPYDTVESSFSAFVYNYMWGPTEFTARGTLKDYDNAHALENIQVPTLFATGEFDEARPSTVKRLSQKVKGSTFTIIPDAAHFTLNDNRAAVVTAIENFLEENEMNIDE